MSPALTRPLARVLDWLLCRLVSFITGVRTQSPAALSPDERPKIYYANHSSHGDFMLVWISLPQEVRMQTQPVAGQDYWLGNRLRRFVAEQVFRVLLIDRQSHPKQAIAKMSDALTQGKSLILFPEGTRNTADDATLLPFKSGLYHLATAHPEIELIPVWINNINRVLPKGKILPIPLLCTVSVGAPLRLHADEDKTAFLTRSRQALLALAPEELK